MTFIRLSVLALVALAAAPSLAFAAAPKSLTIPLDAQEHSGEHGTATLTETPKGLSVVVKMNGAPADPQPMHIHQGACANASPKPSYRLTLLKGGASTSVIPGVTLATLEKTPFSLNVHKSTSDFSYVACGRIAAPHTM